MHFYDRPVKIGMVGYPKQQQQQQQQQ